VDLRRRHLLHHMVRRDLIVEQRQQGLERAGILARLLADHVGPRLDGELMRDQAGMRKRLFAAFGHRILPPQEISICIRCS
jgi:hypothetical protein